jgi:hypothetical protein
MIRLTRVLAAAAAVAALAMPQQAQAVNTLAFSWVIDCNVSGNQYAPLVTMPTGRYVVTVAGACTYGIDDTHSIRVSTCGVSPLPAGPCVDTGASVNGVPGTTCYVGGGIGYVQTCAPPGAYLPGCGGIFTVTVEGQCLNLVPHHVGIVDHTNGGAMFATAVDSFYGDNIGAFVVTAVWTPL